jgi:glucosamine-6-phosphate deaminase
LDFRVFPSSEEAARSLASEIAELIRDKEAAGKCVVFGLATGRTPLPLYRELIRLHQQEGLSFRNVITFNLDEYYGLSPVHPQSYWRFMREQLFDHIDILPENIHLPHGDLPLEEVDADCLNYEDAIQKAGGIDLQILGIGRTGHIGFNEPGSGHETRTRLVELDPVTRADAAGDFGGLSAVPERAVTMGCGTILDSRRLVLMAWGSSKASIVERAFLGGISDDVPASFLQTHPQTSIYLDEPAAVRLAVGCEEKHRLSED